LYAKHFVLDEDGVCGGERCGPELLGVDAWIVLADQVKERRHKRTVLIQESPTRREVSRYAGS
jgi:hypothetical protein